MYFNFHVNPNPQASSGIVIIDNFHPEWRAAAKYLSSNEHFKKCLESYKNIISEWTGIPMNIFWDSELGIRHLSTQPRAAFDLWPEKNQYVSHNIHSPLEVCAGISVMSFYIDNLKFKLKDLSGLTEPS